jgi:uncharacterized protein YqeY
MTVTELQKQKLLLRSKDPVRAGVIEMILDGATKAAKEENRPVTAVDLVSSARKFVKQSEGAIELIKSKNGDATKWESELSVAREYLPPTLSEQALTDLITKTVTEDLTQKNMGKLMSQLKNSQEIKDSGADFADISRVLRSMLK